MRSIHQSAFLSANLRLTLEPLEQRQMLSAVTWTIDSAASILTLSLPDQAFEAHDQTVTGDVSASLWSTHNASSLSGTLTTSYVDGSSIQFLDAPGSIAVLSSSSPSNSVFPNPAGFTPLTDDGTGGDYSGTNGGSAAQNFGGALYDAGGLGAIGPFSLSNVTLDVTSTLGVPQPITAGAFAATGTSGQVDGGAFGLFASNPSLRSEFGWTYVDSNGNTQFYNGVLEGLAASNSSSVNTSLAVATITNLGGGLRQLTLPISIPVSFLPGLTGTLTGSIVAVNRTSIDLDGAGAGTDNSSTWINSGAVKIATSDATITDSLSANMTRLTATITNPAAGDVLSANTVGTSIAASFSGGALTLTGSDTIAHYQQVLESIAFNTTSLATTSRTINVVALDGAGVTSNTAVATVHLDLSAPVVDLNGPAAGTSNTLFWTNTGPVNLTTADATLTDVDSANLSQVTATIVSPVAGDVLAANTVATNITATFANGVLTLSGSDTVAHYQRVLRSLTFDATTVVPSSRTVQIVAFDDSGLASAATIAMVNFDLQAPAVDLNGAAAGTDNSSIWANNGPVPLTTADATISDGDSANLSEMTATIEDPVEGDVLAANVSGTNIAASFAAGTLTLSGTDTVAHYQQVLASLTFDSTALDDGSRTIAIVAVDDGGIAGAPAMATVHPDLSPPTLDLNGAAAGSNYTTVWGNAGAALITAPDATIVDSDSTALQQMTATIVSPAAGDALSAVTAGTNIAATFSSGTLTLTGNDTIANYQQVLRSVTFNTTAGIAGSRVINVVAIDDGGLASAPATVGIALPPVVDLNGPASGTGTTTLLRSVGTVNITTPDATLADSDLSSPRQLTAQIVNYSFGDTLSADTTGTPLVASFSFGTLAVTGNGTVAQYQQVLRSITYSGIASGTPTINVVATDNDGLASAAAVAIVDPPTVDLNGPAVGTSNTVAWTSLAKTAVNISSPTATLIDPDSATLTSLTAAIVSPSTGDVLTANTAGTNLTASFSAGTLTLTGIDTTANYQTVLRSITFNSTTTTHRTVTINVAITDNGGLVGSAAVALVNVDTLAPVVNLSGPGITGNNFATIWLDSGAVSITDPTVTISDADSATLTSLTAAIVSPATGDVLTATTAGTNITASFAAGTLTLSGSDTLANYRTVLKSVAFNTTTLAHRTETINVQATDDGGLTSPTPTTLIDVDSPALVVDLNGPNALGNNYTTVWNHTGAVAVTDPTAAVTDADSATLSSLTATVVNPLPGDALTATAGGGLSVSGNGSASLTISGSTSAAAYSAALQSTKFNSTTVTAPFTNPLDLSDLAIWIPTSGLAAYQEGYDIPGGTTGVGGITPPADGQPIGQIEAPGGTYGSYTAGQYANGNTDRPLLTTVPAGSGNSRAMFSYGTTDSQNTGSYSSATRVNNSIDAFSWLNQGQAFTLQFWTYIPSNSSLAPGAVLFGTTDSLHNDAGFSVRVASMPSGVPQLGVFLDDGTSVQMNYGGSAGSQVPLDTLCCVQITYAGRWTDSTHLATQDAPINIQVTTAAGATTSASSPNLTQTPNTTALAFSNLTLGVNCNASNDGAANPFVGDLGDVVIQHGVASTADLSNYLNHYKLVSENTSPGSSSLLVRQLGAAGGGGLNPEDISMGFMQFDFSDTSKMFADTASYPPTYTTNVTANGAGVGTVQDELDNLMGLPSGTLQRDAVLKSNASAKPTIATNAFMGTQTALQFAGTATTNTALALSIGGQIGTTDNGEPELLTGDETIYLVAKNTAPGTSNGIGQQGSQFLGAFGSQVEFFGSQSQHPNTVRVGTGSGAVYMTDNALPYGPEAWNTVVIRKNAGGYFVYLPDGAGGATMISTTSMSSAAYLALGDIGWSQGTDNAAGLIWKWGVYAADIGDTLAKELVVGLENGGKSAAAALPPRTATVNFAATDDGLLASAPIATTINIDVAPTIDLNGHAPGTGFATQWLGSTPIAIADTAAATIADDDTSLVSMTVTLASPAAGDVLVADTTGTAITQSYSNGTLSLSGADSVADYQAVLRSMTYNNVAGGPHLALETVTIVASDGQLTSAPVTSRIHMLPPSLSLTAGPGSGAPNFTTTWYNQGSIPIESNIVATISAPSGAPTLSSLTVTLATYHSGDVLSVPILNNVSISSSYAAGTLTLSGTDTLAHYQQELRFISYNNTAGGPGVSTITATIVTNDGAQTSAPVTSTIKIVPGSGQVLGNRLFYNNSRFDGNNVAINANDDLSIAPDKTGYNGTGTATFASVSSFNKGITGIMVDLQAGLGTHSAINLTSGDITFKVSPAYVTTTYNKLSTWSAAPTPTAVSVRMGAGQGGSDRLEITWATSAIKEEWLEVDVHAGGNSGLAVDDVFYFGSVIGDSGAGDTALMAKTDGNDYNVALNNLVGLTTPIWNLADYTTDGKVDGNDSTAAISNIFSLHYLVNPTGPFAPNGGGEAAPAASPAAAPAVSASVASAVSSSLSISNSGPRSGPNAPSSTQNASQQGFTSPPAANARHTVWRDPQLLQAVEQFASQFNAHDDALEGLLADLGIN